jgi:hypothetical protein
MFAFCLKTRLELDTDELSAAEPQPKNFYWTQINTDKHRFYIRKKPKDKMRNGARMNTDKRG